MFCAFQLFLLLFSLQPYVIIFSGYTLGRCISQHLFVNKSTLLRRRVESSATIIHYQMALFLFIIPPFKLGFCIYLKKILILHKKIFQYYD